MNKLISCLVPEEMKETIERLLKEGKFASQSEVIRAGLRMLFEKEA